MKRNYIQKTTGKKVKGVTTHLGILAKPALMWWAYKQGLTNYQGLSESLADFIEVHQRDINDIARKNLEVMITEFPVLGLYDKRDAAADAGTLAHEMIECDLHGRPLPDTSKLSDEAVGKANGCYLSFLDWQTGYQVEVLDSEVALTSEQYPFGGTIDHVITTATTPKNRVDILDIKTSKDIYLEAKLQVASYGPLWNEHHPDQLVAGYHILRLGPEGEFTHKYFPNLDPKYFEIFLDCLDIGENLQALGEKL